MFKKSAQVLLLGTLLLAVPFAATAQDGGKGGSKGGSTTVVPTVGGAGKVSVDSLVQRYLPLAGSHTNAQSLVNGLRDGNEVSLSGTVQEQVRVPVQTKVTEAVQVPVETQVTEAVQVPVQTQVTETIQVAVRVPAPPPAPPGTFTTVMRPQTVTKTVTTYKTEYVTKTVTTYKTEYVTKIVTTYKMETVTKPIITNFTPPTGNMGLGNVDIALALTEAVLTQQSIATPTIYQLQNALMDANNGVLQLRAKKMGWGDIAKTLGFEVK